MVMLSCSLTMKTSISKGMNSDSLKFAQRDLIVCLTGLTDRNHSALGNLNWSKIGWILKIYLRKKIFRFVSQVFSVYVMTALSVCVLISLLLVSCVMSVLSQKGFAYTVVVIENDTRLGMEHLVFDKWLQNSISKINNCGMR